MITPTRWQYVTVVNVQQEDFDDLGDAGWELVDVISKQMIGQNQLVTVAYFKRPLPSGSIPLTELQTEL